MDAVFLSQVASMEGPQLELDKVGKAQNTSLIAQAAQEEVFLTMLQRSMEMVHETTQSEKEDPLKEGEEDEDHPEE